MAIFRTFSTLQPLKCSVLVCKKSKPKTFILSISFIDLIREKLPFFEKPEDKIAKYWETNSVVEVTEHADRLFEEERYMDVYETLNRIKYSKDVEVIWRIAKALYNLSLSETFTIEVKKEMIKEAYQILDSSSHIGEGTANYHKWKAIILNMRHGMVNLETKIKGYPLVKEELEKACQINPKDFSVQYMLGRWHYEMTNFTWVQRLIAKYLFLEPPEASIQKAYKHLYKAEELHPRSFLPNIYLLGRVCLKLGQYYRAKYYLNMVLSLQAHSDCERCCVSSARSLYAKLMMFDLGKDLLYENPFEI